MMAAIIFNSRTGNWSWLTDDYFVAEVPDDADNDAVDDLVHDDKWAEAHFKSVSGMIERDR